MACNGRETWSGPRASLGCAIMVVAAVVGRRRDGIAIPAWRTEFIELELTDGGSKFPRD